MDCCVGWARRCPLLLPIQTTELAHGLFFLFAAFFGQSIHQLTNRSIDRSMAMDRCRTAASSWRRRRGPRPPRRGLGTGRSSKRRVSVHLSIYLSVPAVVGPNPIPNSCGRGSCLSISLSLGLVPTPRRRPCPALTQLLTQPTDQTNERTGRRCRRSQASRRQRQQPPFPAAKADNEQQGGGRHHGGGGRHDGRGWRREAGPPGGGAAGAPAGPDALSGFHAHAQKRAPVRSLD